jgi:hypothetical protein
MKMNVESGIQLRKRALAITKRALDGEYDLLLACRDLKDLREHLRGVPEDVIDILIAVESELDASPIGFERRNWSLDALKAQDVKTDRYREQVRNTVMEALRRLVSTLEPY